MQKNPKLIKGLVLASLLGMGAAAQAQYSAIVSVAPPAPRYERAPAPRPGYVWDAGHYEWRNGRYAWVPGRWLQARAGHDFQERRWVQRGNGQWVLVGGGWQRRGPYGDRDGDGIANRHDRHNNMAQSRPNGDLDRDGVRNRNDRDRDGDGVANHRDRYPDNRRRS